MTAKQLNEISDATLKRLPLYYRELVDIKDENREFVSCTTISNRTGYQSITVRKDLQKAGAIGKPKVGYSVEQIVNLLSDVLGLNHDNSAVLIGAGNLGNAILGYKGFENCGLNIAAAFDIDNIKLGTDCQGKHVLPMDSLEETIKKLNIKIGIITVPPAYAQGIAQTLVNAGIAGIWNFTSVKINVPDNIVVENVDLSTSLSVLTTKLNSH